MCLKYAGYERSQRGFGYKVVRRLRVSVEGSYRPYFSHFMRSGIGGAVMANEEVPSYLKELVSKTQVTYYYNEVSRVRHKRLAKALDGQIYVAGIHLWLDLDYAKERFRALQILDEDPCLALVKFHWSSPYARDGETVVVSRATPVEEISVEEQPIPDEED
jgi:hypothetical protein